MSNNPTWAEAHTIQREFQNLLHRSLDNIIEPSSSSINSTSDRLHEDIVETIRHADSDVTAITLHNISVSKALPCQNFVPILRLDYILQVQYFYSGNNYLIPRRNSNSVSVNYHDPRRFSFHSIPIYRSTFQRARHSPIYPQSIIPPSSYLLASAVSTRRTDKQRLATKVLQSTKRVQAGRRCFGRFIAAGALILPSSHNTLRYYSFERFPVSFPGV
jgi:hypothetical protein